MIQIICGLGLAGLLFLGGCANPGLRNDRPAGQPQAERAASPARSELRVGLTTREVRALLGEPDDLIISSGERAPERWKYYHSPDCAPQLAPSTPTTELVFVGGRLQKWVKAKKPSEGGAEPQ
jgi:hypothetical protein